MSRIFSVSLDDIQDSAFLFLLDGLLGYLHVLLGEILTQSVVVTVDTQSLSIHYLEAIALEELVAVLRDSTDLVRGVVHHSIEDYSLSGILDEMLALDVADVLSNPSASSHVLLQLFNFLTTQVADLFEPALCHQA